MAITRKIADYFKGYVNVDLLSDLRNRKTLGERRTWGCCI